jgi:hypothetical protein
MSINQVFINCELDVYKTPYNAGLDSSTRRSVHERFLSDDLQATLINIKICNFVYIKIVVATVAFGMGIDKHDVRTVVHYGSHFFCLRVQRLSKYLAILIIYIFYCFFMSFILYPGCRKVLIAIFRRLDEPGETAK